MPTATPVPAQRLPDLDMADMDQSSCKLSELGEPDEKVGGLARQHGTSLLKAEALDFTEPEDEGYTKCRRHARCSGELAVVKPNAGES